MLDGQISWMQSLKRFWVFQLEKSILSFPSFGKCNLYKSVLIDEMAVYNMHLEALKKRG
jgi:hypothetical protein